MKKILSILLAAAAVLSLNITALAATDTTADKEYNIIKITGQPVLDTGKQFASTDSVAPNQTIYFTMPSDLAAWYNNAKNVNVRVRKARNAKLIGNVRIVDKKLSSTGYDILVPNSLSGAPKIDTVGDYAKYNSQNRNTYIAVELNDMTGSDEYKVEFAITFTAKRAPATPFYYKHSYTGTRPDNAQVYFDPKVGSKLTLTGALYVANQQGTGDSSVTVGKTGMTIKPLANDVNEISFEDGTTYATLTFTAANHPDKFYAKLSTKWTNSLLAKFKNTDAVIRKFNPATIDSVSRATLALNNPFDSDSVDPRNVYIYTADSKGTLKDVTNSFTYDKYDDAYITRTRVLTTYIISDKKVKTA